MSSTTRHPDRRTETALEDRPRTSHTLAPESPRTDAARSSSSASGDLDSHGLAVASLHGRDDAAERAAAVVDANVRTLPGVNPAALRGEQALSERDWLDIRIVSDALRAACEEDPDRQAGVARALGKSRNFVSKCCDRSDPQTLPARYIGRLPHVVRRVYLQLLNREYRAEVRVSEADPRSVSAGMVTHVAQMFDHVFHTLADGKVSPDELRRHEQFCDEVERCTQMLRVLMRRHAEKGAA